LVRFIAGEDNPVLSDSVRAAAVEHYEEAGQLGKLGFDESVIEPDKRVPRVTTAFWKHKKGTLGTLCHGITMHDHDYDTELEVLADGWIIKLRGAYTSKPVLSIAGPHMNKDQMDVIAEEDDPFYSEMKAVVDAVDGTNVDSRDLILSSFQDALQTYALTWKIRQASEE
jgi:hypothetical protein